MPPEVTEVGFDIGTDDGYKIKMESTNRIKFSVILKQW